MNCEWNSKKVPKEEDQMTILVEKSLIQLKNVDVLQELVCHSKLNLIAVVANELSFVGLIYLFAEVWNYSTYLLSCVSNSWNSSLECSSSRQPMEVSVQATGH